MPVAIDVGPDLDPLADDPLHREAAAVDQRIDILDMESAAGLGALDSLSCFVHGDAIDMETTSRFDCGKGDAPDLYRKPLAGHWFPGNAGVALELNTAILFLHLENFATAPCCCVQTACRMDLFTKANDLGIQTDFIDGLGNHRVTSATALKIIIDALPTACPAPASRRGRGHPAGPSGADRAQAGCHASRCTGKSLRILRLSRRARPVIPSSSGRRICLRAATGCI